MQENIEFTKREILRFFTERNARAGYALHMPAFSLQMTSWTPKQRDAFTPALEQLVNSGFLEQNQKGSIVLTQIGEDQIY